MKPYYYVYNYGNQAPRVRHATIEDAEKEACRLAKDQPGASFEILQCIGVTRCTEPSTEWVTPFNSEPEKEPEPQYRMLETGESIKEGDEYFDIEEQMWVTAKRIGMQPIFCNSYRRRVQ